MAFFAGMVQVFFGHRDTEGTEIFGGRAKARPYGFRGGCGWRFLRGWYGFFGHRGAEGTEDFSPQRHEGREDCFATEALKQDRLSYASLVYSRR